MHDLTPVLIVLIAIVAERVLESFADEVADFIHNIFSLFNDPLK